MKINSRLDRIINSLPTGKSIIMRSLSRVGRAWDPWLIKDSNVYRLFYLANPKAVGINPGVWWAESTIYGAISTDLKQWKHLGIILEPEPANAWESKRMLAGFTYKENNIYYLFYSAAGKEDTLDEGIGLATSTDGLQWHRCSTYPLFSNLNERDRWYGKYEDDVGDGIKVQHRHWRDPYIVKDYKTGKYYMFICAASVEREPNQFRGCVGLAVANTIAGPYKLLPPASAPVVNGTNESIYVEMERPQVIYKNGKYHLFFSCWTHRLNPKWLQQVGRDRITRSSLYWYTAEDITGPFKPISDKPVIPGSERTGMYGTNFFPAPNTVPEEYIACGWYHYLFTLGVSPLLFRVHWTDSSVEIRSSFYF